MKKLIGIVALVLLVSTFSYSSNVDARPGTGQVWKVLKTIKQVYTGFSLFNWISGNSGEKSGTVIQECGCWGNYQPPSQPRCESEYVQARRCEGSCFHSGHNRYYFPYAWVCK